MLSPPMEWTLGPNSWSYIINAYGLKMDTVNMVTMRISRTNVSIKGNNTVVKDMDKSIYMRYEIISKGTIDGHINTLIRVKMSKLCHVVKGIL
jgi:hypothetical protein